MAPWRNQHKRNQHKRNQHKRNQPRPILLAGMSSMLIIRHDHSAALAQILDDIRTGLATQDRYTFDLARWHTTIVLAQARDLLRADGIYLGSRKRARHTRQWQATAHRANPTNGNNNS